MGPSRAPVATATVITAVVSNLGTDVGATADCQLFAGDSPDIVDQASAIWIDGGDSVNCVFSHVFNALGSQTVRVAIVNAAPADDDPINNQATGTIDVFDIQSPQVAWTISKNRMITDQGHLHSDGWVKFEYPRIGGPVAHGSDWNYDYVYDLVANEAADITLTSSTSVSYPLANLDLSFSSGGQDLVSMHASNVTPDDEFGDAESGGATLSRYDTATQTSLYFQTYHDRRDVSTYLYALRIANRTTYWATGYRHDWITWGGVPTQDSYQYYTPRNDAAGTLSPELDETVQMSIVDAAGRTFAGGGTVTPASEEQIVDQPLVCNDGAHQTIFGFQTFHVCAEESSHSVFSFGIITGTSGGY